MMKLKNLSLAALEPFLRDIMTAKKGRLLESEHIELLSAVWSIFSFSETYKILCRVFPERYKHEYVFVYKNRIKMKKSEGLSRLSQEIDKYNISIQEPDLITVQSKRGKMEIILPRSEYDPTDENFFNRVHRIYEHRRILDKAAKQGFGYDEFSAEVIGDCVWTIKHLK